MMLVCIRKPQGSSILLQNAHFFFHLNTFNSNTVCSYKGFSPQIYALLVTTLLPSAVNLIQKKTPQNLMCPDCTVNLKKIYH